MEKILKNSDVTNVVEIIKNKLYFATWRFSFTLRDSWKIHFFSIDNDLVYTNFYEDFGPLNLGCLYEYCQLVNKKLNNHFHKEKAIVHYTSENEKKRANAAYLIGAYAVIYLNKTPEEIFNVLISPDLPPLKPFQDACVKKSNYTISLIDCLRGLFKALYFGFINFKDFDLYEYEMKYNHNGGCLNWVIPEKFIAFQGPNTEPFTCPPEFYVNYFIKNNVKAVVRLNKRAYDKRGFTSFGIDHYDMFIHDGDIPTPLILQQFLNLAETINGAVAVHCKAGLGRTGTLIAAYLIKHYKMTAKESIAWIRICRPGSVIGFQQRWLESMEKSLWDAGDEHRFYKFHVAEEKHVLSTLYYAMLCYAVLQTH